MSNCQKRIQELELKLAHSEHERLESKRLMLSIAHKGEGAVTELQRRIELLKRMLKHEIGSHMIFQANTDDAIAPSPDEQLSAEGRRRAKEILDEDIDPFAL